MPILTLLESLLSQRDASRRGFTLLFLWVGCWAVRVVGLLLAIVGSTADLDWLASAGGAICGISFFGGCIFHVLHWFYLVTRTTDPDEDFPPRQTRKPIDASPNTLIH